MWIFFGKLEKLFDRVMYSIGGFSIREFSRCRGDLGWEGFRDRFILG